jgi:MFS family permease
MTAVLAIRIFTPFALGYFVVSIFRSINAVIAPELVRDLGLGATELGFVVSALFLGGTMFQLPCGVLLDRHDPRRVYAILLAISGVGAVTVALAQGVAMLATGRALIALGTTTGAVTSYKVYSMWFPSDRLPLVNGLSLAAGGLGLMAGTALSRPRSRLLHGAASMLPWGQCSSFARLLSSLLHPQCLRRRADQPCLSR